MIKRSNLAALALSASALVGLATHEGYRGTAYIPVPGDVPTIGFGTTSGVKLGDTITPEKALSRALTDIQAFEGALKRCVKVPLHQHEYDAAVSFSYNVGASAFCGSTMVKKWNAGDYAGGCNELPRWVKAGGRVLPGLVKRREAERVLCLGLSINNEVKK
ncbi:MAG: lysozyme [Methylobacter sp.]|nr:lysozyme [Methylobacter sp.]MDP2169646.1 lysozyme [Rhodocyclaceae bacterium]MDP2429041.1 lysozyme [Methylobacter sp.]MDP3056542.1 lysozyme [Methylobacter sp.]MDP3362031.1 lysozyme [Methylobacter sp.]